MKNVYKKFMALACMFLLVGASALAADGWNAYNKTGTNSVTVTTSYTNVFSANVQTKADQQITYTREGGTTSTKAGLQVRSSNKLYLKPTTAGFLNLRLACESGYPLTVTIHDNTSNQDVASVYIETPVSTLTYHGETVLFEVEANHEYVLNASDNRTYYFVVISKMESSEMLELNDEMTASQMSSLIGSGTYYITKITRTLRPGVWNTFCFPQRLGIHAVRAELKSDDPYEMTGYDATEKIVTFTKSDHIDPNKPYLIMPNESVSEVTIFNSTAAAYNPGSVTYNGLAFKAALAATDIYTTGNASSTKFYLNAQGKFVYPTSNAGNNGTIKGFRGYFEWVNGVPEHDVKGMSFIFEDDETGIIRVEQGDIFNENAPIYSIDGRLMGNSKENLSRGIYVQNGRKFIVK